MANDPNIILQGQQQDPSNTINAFLMGRKLAQENREYENQNRLAEILQNTPREKLADTLYQQGMFKEGQDYEKNQADISKTNAETGIKQFEHHKNMLDNTLNLISSMEDNPMLNKAMMLSGLETSKAQGLIDDTVYVPALKELEALPDDTIALRQFSKQKKTQLLGVKENMKYQMPTANAQLQAQATQANAQLGAETQRRGQDISAETQRGGQQFNYDLGMQRLENDRQKSALTGLKQPVIPAAIQSAYVGNKTALEKINSALAMVEKKPNAFGLKNMAGDAIMQRLDADGVDARAMISDIASLKIHDRSGAAVTAAEMPRLKPFIPNTTDTDATIKTKLNNFKKEYEQINREYEQLHPGLGGANNGHGASDSWGGVDYKQKHGVTEEEHAEVMRLLGR
jgi:hypothetical protein